MSNFVLALLPTQSLTGGRIQSGSLPHCKIKDGEAGGLSRSQKPEGTSLYIRMCGVMYPWSPRGTEGTGLPCFSLMLSQETCAESALQRKGCWAPSPLTQSSSLGSADEVWRRGKALLSESSQQPSREALFPLTMTWIVHPQPCHWLVL